MKAINILINININDNVAKSLTLDPGISLSDPIQNYIIGLIKPAIFRSASS